MHIGDICYANGYISQWDQFTAQVEPIASTVPYMIARFHYNILAYTCLYFVLLSKYFVLCANWWSILAVVIMNVTGQGLDPSMGTQTLAGNVVCWLRLCFMSLQKIGPNYGTEIFASFWIWLAFHSSVSLCIYMKSGLLSDWHSPIVVYLYVLLINVSVHQSPRTLPTI